MNNQALRDKLLAVLALDPPATRQEAYDVMAILGGMVISICRTLDEGNPYSKEPGWQKNRVDFLSGALYMLATTTPEIPAAGMTLAKTLDSLLCLTIEKCMLNSLKGDDHFQDEVGTAIAAYLRQATGLYLTCVHALKRPDLNIEQLEAKGQDILNSLTNCFLALEKGKK